MKLVSDCGCPVRFRCSSPALIQSKEPAPPPAPVKAAPADHYSMADFTSAKKLDAHVHINVLDPAFRDQAREDGFELMAINVDYPDFPKLADQRAAALAQKQADPRARALGQHVLDAGLRQTRLGRQGGQTTRG